MTVKFTAHDHTYKNSRGNKLISVTTLIGLYKPKEDWRKIATDYVNRRSKEELIYAICERYMREDSEVRELFETRGYTADTILWIWNKNKEEACEIGTDFHEDKELEIINDGGYEDVEQEEPKFYDYRGFNDDTEYLKHLQDGIYPELRLYLEDFMLAGTADKVIVDGRYVDIDDHKTNKGIDKSSFRGKKMLAPLDNVMDCNFEHYQLQISIYAYMLECLGYIPRKLTFRWYRKTLKRINGERVIEVSDRPQIFELVYKRDSVIKLLNHYKASRNNVNLFSY